jgi:O-antigen ligase
MDTMTQGRNNLGWILPVFLPSAIALSVLMVFAPQPLAVLVIPVVIVAILFFIAHSAAGLYLLVLALPFQRLEVILAGQIGVSPVDLIIWPWLLAYGAQALTRGIHKTKLLLFVAIWLLSTLISGIVATNSRAFLVALGSTTIYAMFLVAAYDQLSRRPEVLRSITDLYIGMALFVALFGGLQLVGLVPNPLSVPYFGLLIGGDDPLRMASFLSNANLLAGYLSVAIFFSWVMYRQSSGIRRLRYLTAFLILLVSLLFTFSRAAFTGSAVGAMILYMSRSNERLGKRFFKLAIAAAVIAVGLAIFTVAYSVLFRSTNWTPSDLLAGDTTELDSSSRKRLIFWEMALRMYESSPVVGVGAGHFQIQFERYIPPQFRFLEVANAHNTYLQILAESGLVGLSAFIALFGYIVVAGLRAKGAVPDVGERLNAALAGLVTLLVIGLTHNMVKTEIWFVAALVLAYTHLYRSSPEAPGGGRQTESSPLSKVRVA